MFKRLIYRTKIKRHLAKLSLLQRDKSFVLPEDAKNCLLFRSTRGDNNIYVERLKQIFPHIEFVDFWHISSGTIAPSGVDMSAVVSWGNLTRSGFKRADKAVELLGKQFDWLIDLSNDNSDLAELLLLTSKASCKISWRYIGNFVADITLKDIDNRKEFVERIPELFLSLSVNTNGK